MRPEVALIGIRGCSDEDPWWELDRRTEVIEKSMM
jgi:hypothetical protein